VAPTSLPDLRRVPTVAIDTEGKDDGLGAGTGSSWPFGGGFLCGVSVAWPGGSFYAPVRHPDTECMDPDVVAQWVSDHAKAGVRFVTHHGSHDWGWMGTEWGIPVPEHIDDTEGMAALVDENRLSYRLDDLCRWRGIPGKDEDKLREAAAAYGFSNVKANMHKMPARYIGPYAEQDAVSTLALRDDLAEEVERQELGPAYQLEMDIMPMVLQMRRDGIRVDVDGAIQAKANLRQRRDEVLAELARRLGVPNVTIEQCRSPRVLVEWHLDQGVFTRETMPMTAPTRGHPDGQPSFQASWMRRHSHWLPSMVAKAEQLEEAAQKFIQGFILDYTTHRGRIHAGINQFRGEEGGTRSHRFSYSDPPLQQMPARDGELAEIIRGLFLPEPGQVWGACDYSQQEYRLIVHFAYLLKCGRAEEAVRLYIDNPDTDFHILVSEWTSLERKPAKDTNFAKAFGAGIPKFAQMIGQSVERAAEIYAQYDRELPFVKEAAKVCQNVAEKRGYIRLLDGARSHFDFWEPAWRERDESYVTPRPLASAQEHWGKERRLKRAWGHKAMNRLIQGSAARQTKLAMRACWREGLVPRIQMHDELGFSFQSLGEARRASELMRDVVQLSVPMKVDCELGSTWGVATRKIDGDKTAKVPYGPVTDAQFEEIRAGLAVTEVRVSEPAAMPEEKRRADARGFNKTMRDRKKKSPA
jgi:DNA polymerase I-like protein with 3'-5' exonuclease and polymerase domains